MKIYELAFLFEIISKEQTVFLRVSGRVSDLFLRFNSTELSYVMDIRA